MESDNRIRTKAGPRISFMHLSLFAVIFIFLSMYAFTAPSPLGIRVTAAIRWESNLPEKPKGESMIVIPSPFVTLDRELQLYTYELCREKEVDYALALALMWQESRFHINALHVNDDGTHDIGLMQINDSNREWLSRSCGITNLRDPKQNILAGVSILAGYEEKYDSRTALMAYQMGEGGMRKAVASGTVTTETADKILAKRDEYQAILDGSFFQAL